MIWVPLGALITWFLVEVMGAPFWYALTACLVVGGVVPFIHMKPVAHDIEEES
jgi:hypothetical protein